MKNNKLGDQIIVNWGENMRNKGLRKKNIIERRRWRRFEKETNEGHRHYLKMVK